MNTRMLLGAALCVFVAVIAVAFLALGGKKMPIAPAESETQTGEAEPKANNSFPVTIPDILPGVSETVTDKQGEPVTNQKGEPETVTAAVTTVQTTKVGETTTAAETAAETTAKETTVKETTTAAREEKTTAAKTTTTKAAKNDDYEYAYAGFHPAVATVSEANWNMLLVNQDYILPEGYKVKTAKIADGTQSLDYRVVPYYNKMVAAAKADGISLLAVSGYRSLDRQRANFTRKINYYQGLGYSKAEATRLAAKIVLMPGTSEHNAGLAMDFGTNGNATLDENFGKTEAYKWLSKHAADYGFIMRYPADKTNITKVTYEPWHWRYVGEKAAKEIKARGVTLEEYLGY